MDYRQIYEILLKTICENDKHMLELLARITRCDDVLYDCTVQDEPDLYRIQALNTQKERLIEQLERLTTDEESYISQLNSIASLCSEVLSHPLYYKMELLHDAISKRMEQVIHKEDTNNPTINSRLSDFRDKLELDLRISEIPMEKRHIFYIYPEK